MKLDRNINPDGRGKYALINLRKTDLALGDIRECVSNSLGGQCLTFGTNPETAFFVIKLKDKYAGPALHAYAEAAKADDPEYAAEIDALAQAADRIIPKRMPD